MLRREFEKAQTLAKAKALCSAFCFSSLLTFLAHVWRLFIFYYRCRNDHTSINLRKVLVHYREKLKHVRILI